MERRRKRSILQAADFNVDMVGTIGFEPTTSSVSRKRSNQLSYAPSAA
jgi:hypothetical protein